MLTKLIMVIISQYINTLNHYVVQLELTQYVNNITIKLEKIHWHFLYAGQFENNLSKIKGDKPFDLEIPLLSTYPINTVIFEWNNYCSLVCTFKRLEITITESYLNYGTAI